MDRKLNKKELDLWKEVTKEDTKINTYISENNIEKHKNETGEKKKILKTPRNNNRTADISSNDQTSYNTSNTSRSQKLQINRRMKAKLLRGLIRPEATLDLHGYNRLEAEDTLKSFISTCIRQEKRCILIVTGKRKSTLGSKSILRELVPKWLDGVLYSNLILAHSYAIQKDGGDGARYVLLRKKGIEI